MEKEEIRLKITLKKYGSTVEYNLTSWLITDQSFQMSNETERDAFERVCGDIHLTFTNARRQFNDIFTSTIGQEEWRIYINDDSLVERFSGEIWNSTILFSINNESVSFDCYSFQGMFWDMCGNKKIKIQLLNAHDLDMRYTLVYNDLKTVIEYNLETELQGDIFNTVELQDCYINRKIRWYKTDEVAGNGGRYSYLDPDTTVKELFEAFSRFYNLEFIVDHPNKKLIVQKRRFPNSGSAKSIKVKEDSPIEYKPCGENKYDYIYSIFKYVTPGKVVLKSLSETEIYISGAPTGYPSDVFKGICENFINPSQDVGGNEKEGAEIEIDTITATTDYIKTKTKHGLLSGDIIGIKEVSGSNIINNENYIVTYISQYEFTVQRLSETFPFDITSDGSGGKVWKRNERFQLLYPRFYYFLVAVNGETPFSITMPTIAMMNHAYINETNYHTWLSHGHYKGMHAKLIIPKCADGTTKRLLYRTHWIIDRGLNIDLRGIYFVWTFWGNDEQEFDDTKAYYRSNFADYPLDANILMGIAAWFGYNEETGSWLDPLLDYTNSKSDPLGSKVFDAIPKLRWVDGATKELFDSTFYDIYCFFGKDNSNEYIRDEFIDLLKTKALLTCSTKDNNINSGDEIIRPELQNVSNLPNSNLLVKNAIIDFLKEETRLEMVQL